MKLFKFLVVFGLFIGFTSCEKDPLTQPKIDATTTELLVSANPAGTEFTLFSFADGKTILGTDKQSDKWDIGLKDITFAVNSGLSGPGKGGAIIVTDVFDNVLEAPETGYKIDNSASDLAISGTAWYDYNSTTRAFTPKAGVVFIIKTAKGNFAKMEVVKADPADDAGKIVVPPTRPTKYKYTIRYVYQPNGKRFFTK
jgi:HmuY protein